jgi:hypothetical protein
MPASGKESLRSALAKQLRSVPTRISSPSTNPIYCKLSEKPRISTREVLKSLSYVESSLKIALSHEREMIAITLTFSFRISLVCAEKSERVKETMMVGCACGHQRTTGVKGRWFV